MASGLVGMLLGGDDIAAGMGALQLGLQQRRWGRDVCAVGAARSMLQAEECSTGSNGGVRMRMARPLSLHHPGPCVPGSREWSWHLPTSGCREGHR